MPVDVYRTGEHCVVHVELAGVDPGSADVELSDSGELTVTAYRTARTDDQLRWRLRERPTGLLRRRIQLGRGLDPTAVQATHNDGVLTVTIPLRDGEQPRRIPVGRQRDDD